MRKPDHTAAVRAANRRLRLQATGVVQCNVLVPAWAVPALKHGAECLRKVAEPDQLGAVVGVRTAKGRVIWFKA